MTCSEKACILPAFAGGPLCQHHARMFSGTSAFDSSGCRASVETITEHEQERRRLTKYAVRPMTHRVDPRSK